METITCHRCGTENSNSEILQEPQEMNPLCPPQLMSHDKKGLGFLQHKRETT